MIIFLLLAVLCFLAFVWLVRRDAFDLAGLGWLVACVAYLFASISQAALERAWRVIDSVKPPAPHVEHVDHVETTAEKIERIQARDRATRQ